MTTRAALKAEYGKTRRKMSSDNFNFNYQSYNMSSSSTLPASSQQANKAALSAALTENPLQNTQANPETEPGEIQEVDMHAQAEGIRTVFSDPTNFNVKVCLTLCPWDAGLTLCGVSTPSTLPGRFGSIHPRPRVAISPRHPSPLSRRHPYLRPPALQQHKVGWRILNA